MAISNESNSYELVKPPFRKGLAMAIGFSPMLASHHATNSRRFCQSRDGKVPQQFLALRLTIRKAFNRDSLRLRPISQLVGDCIAWLQSAGNLGFDYALLLSVAGQLGFLERILDENWRNDA